MPESEVTKTGLNREEKLRHMSGFFSAPIWQEIIKPALIIKMNKANRDLIRSADPAKDWDLKSEIRATSWFLDFETQFANLLKEVEREQIEAANAEKARQLAVGTPYEETPS